MLNDLNPSRVQGPASRLHAFLLDAKGLRTHLKRTNMGEELLLPALHHHRIGSENPNATSFSGGCHHPCDQRRDRRLAESNIVSQQKSAASLLADTPVQAHEDVVGREKLSPSSFKHKWPT